MVADSIKYQYPVQHQALISQGTITLSTNTAAAFTLTSYLYLLHTLKYNIFSFALLTMATTPSKQLQSDPTKAIFLDALKKDHRRPENAKNQKNIQAMVTKAIKSGPPKPKHTWWALDGKVYDVENKHFQETT